MMEDTIRKDVLDVDQRILELAAKLSNERANLIRHELGLALNKLDDRSFTVEKISSDLSRKMNWSGINSRNQISPMKALANRDYNTLMWK